MDQMEAAVVAEKESEEPAPSFWDMVATKEMRLALTAGVGLQVGELGLQIQLCQPLQICFDRFVLMYLRRCFRPLRRVPGRCFESLGRYCYIHWL
jgi:hypothetical protein